MVVPPGAVSIDGTFARINTLAVSAGQGIGAVWISEALVWFAMAVRIAIMEGRTETVGLVTVRLTDGIGSTFFEQAWILTFSVNASLIVSAFKVALAASYIKETRI